MKSDCYFDECKDCLYREHSDDLVCCAASRLGLACHRLVEELPIINRLIDGHKSCSWYQKDEEVEVIHCCSTNEWARDYMDTKHLKT